ncbi:AAA family ATPase, partial [Alienimonas sp. DA493]|uniref:AAA family ATPase n=1 Tax=Alienimonas sp. DA493 TaxID=3373605 RepID=UPI0037540BC4
MAGTAAAEDGADGRPIEWAVEMKQFPAERLMSARLAAGAVTEDDARRPGRRIAAWHADAERTDAPADPVGWNRRILDAALDALRQRLGSVGRRRVDALGRWAAGFLREHADRFAARAEAGAYRLCHGDLNVDNLLWTPAGFRAFDALEFDDDLRRTDVAADLAFAVTDLAARGRVDLSRQTLAAYLEASGDYEALDVLRFYFVGRAAVRALVHELYPRDSAGRPSEPGSAEYLAEAEPFAEGDPPLLAITHGVTAAGKTTAARRFAAETGAVWLRSDAERVRLPNLPQGWAEHRYSRRRTGPTYSRLRVLAGDALRDGWPVVVDAACLKERQRRPFAELAERTGAPFTILDCDVSPIEAAERITRRLSADADESEPTLAVLAEQLETAEPLTAAERPFTRPAAGRPAVAAPAAAGKGGRGRL